MIVFMSFWDFSYLGLKDLWDYSSDLDFRPWKLNFSNFSVVSFQFLLKFAKKKLNGQYKRKSLQFQVQILYKGCNKIELSGKVHVSTILRKLLTKLVSFWSLKIQKILKILRYICLFLIYQYIQTFDSRLNSMIDRDEDDEWEN